MKNDTASITVEQKRDLSSALGKCVPTDLSFGDAQYWIGSKGLLSQKIKSILKRSSEDIRKEIQLLVSRWGPFYNKYFGFTPDLRDVKIPEKKPGFDRLIIVRGDLNPNQVFKVCQKHFSCDKYGVDLDKETKGRNEREPTKTYAIWVRDRQEADEELKNMSAETIKEKNITTETLLEREIHELKFFDETGKHLDEKNVTLCAGSRFSGGFVPYANWYGGKFDVARYDSQSASSSLCARAAVSF